MCLGIPMKIKKIKGEFAEVESGKLVRTVNIQMLSHAREGDYIIVHAGFAIEKVDPRKAKETLKIIDEIY
ncbi:MAG: HypC/HybG/HupF family hydrogenase formation chaperone [Candidatus Omnitrophica bacterium]|nr:HypC/HybG/HupF family hydrogenase formation chaperone [Candidatus Omnitrophota bacterium]